MQYKPLLVAIQVQNYGNAAAHFHHDLCSKVCGSESILYFNKSPLLPVNVFLYLLRRLGPLNDKTVCISLICDFGLLQAVFCLLLLRLFTATGQISFHTTYYHHVIPLRILLKSSFRLNELYKLFSCILFRGISNLLPSLSNLFFVITVSPNSKSHILEYTGLSKSNIFCLYNPQFSAVSFNSCTDVTSLPVKSNKILVVSNLQARKNPGLIFDLLKRYSCYIKIVVPSKKITPNLKKLTSASNSLCSNLSSIALRELYRSSSYVVVPSFFEGLSLVPLEAISNSAIVVLSDIPVHRLLCLPDIQYFDPHSFESLSKTISDLDNLPFASLLSNQAEAVSRVLPSIQRSMNTEFELFLRSFYYES